MASHSGEGAAAPPPPTSDTSSPEDLSSASAICPAASDVGRDVTMPSVPLEAAEDAACSAGLLFEDGLATATAGGHTQREQSAQDAQSAVQQSAAGGQGRISSTADGAAEVSGSRPPIRQSSSPLISAVWIGMELVITLSQVIAAIVVLAVSGNEKPKAPLRLWIVGYTVACVATFPLLYWRYVHRCLRVRPTGDLARRGSQLLVSERGSAPRISPSGSEGPSSSSSEQASPVRSPSSSESAPSPPHYESLAARSMEEPAVQRLQRSAAVAEGQQRSRLRRSIESRLAMLAERFKVLLDCFFAVWFVIGNVWMFGGHASLSDAPNLYSLCVAFLTLSCMGYAVPFLLCATICCCLPCIIAFMGYVEESQPGKGASAEAIKALPTYKYKLQPGLACRPRSASGDGNRQGESDGEDVGEAGLLWAGTQQERRVAGEDAVCCICLGKYDEGEELRELPCAHHFHVSCVDTWLKINANCPLCKHKIGSDGDGEEEQVLVAGPAVPPVASTGDLPV